MPRSVEQSTAESDFHANRNWRAVAIIGALYYIFKAKYQEGQEGRAGSSGSKVQLPCRH